MAAAASLVTVLKSGTASTLSSCRACAIFPRIKLTLPRTQHPPLADQAVFVRASVNGVIREAIIAAVLTGLMILLFLGSWRATIIIAISIPLSILSSIIILGLLGQTINIMTLGGLALAVGILVDDATVTIENIERYLEEGAELNEGILEGAAQIAVPALVSTLCICIVFLPMFFLSGVARYLFVPLAEAVVFAMLASYALSRTLVPTLAMYLLKKHDHHAAPSRASSARFQRGFERRFERVRAGYEGCSTRLIALRFAFVPIFLRACLLLLPADPIPRPELLPVKRQRLLHAPRPRPIRHPHRRNRQALRRDRSSASAPSSRTTRPTTSSTTSASLTPPSTPSTPPPASRARATPTSSSRSTKSTTPPRATSPSYASSFPACFPAPSSTSSRPTSSPRSSTSACPRPSTSSSTAPTSTATARSSTRFSPNSQRSPASSTSASSSPTITLRSRSTSTASRPSRVAITSATSAPPLSTSFPAAPSSRLSSISTPKTA